MTRPTIRYRCPARDGAPPTGAIVMGAGKRVRRAYRVLSATKTRNCMPMLGFSTYRLAVEPMAAERGRAEIEAGAPWWRTNQIRRSTWKPVSSRLP
ncbi:MAG: hypothetical protein KGL39_58000 [Patescibacteria group bacterium]|nr:hypothetical protein [Patescibacteria group bacterium]